MLIILCAEMSEAKNIKCNDAMIIVTGVGYYNAIKSIGRLVLDANDKIINIGYAGSNKYATGEVISANRSQKINTSKTIDEPSIKLSPLGASDLCYTADDFIVKQDKTIPLADMELYYLALIYPQIQSIKIVSDNLNLTEHRQADLSESWDIVNKILEGISNE